LDKNAPAKGEKDSTTGFSRKNQKVVGGELKGKSRWDVRKFCGDDEKENPGRGPSTKVIASVVLKKRVKRKKPL